LCDHFKYYETAEQTTYFILRYSTTPTGTKEFTWVFSFSEGELRRKGTVHVRALVPKGLSQNNLSLNEWRALPKVERDDFIAEVVNHFLREKEKPFLEAQVKLAQSHKLVSHLASIMSVSGQVLLYDIVKTQLRKLSQPRGRNGQKDYDVEKN
jgi:hypothetical protein